MRLINKNRKSTRGIIGAVLGLLVLAAPLLVFGESGQNGDGLYVFAPETRISAGEVNDNFALLTDWIKELIDAVAALSQSSPPVGAVVAYAGPVDASQGAPELPEGWALCDGASVYRTGKYAALYEAIGTAWGAEDSSHFNLPDMRGVFLRGVNHGALNPYDELRNPDDPNQDPDIDLMDPGANGRLSPQPDQYDPGNVGDAVGSLQIDQMQSHKHTDSGHDHGYDRFGVKDECTSGSKNVADYDNHDNADTSTATAKLGNPTNSGSGAGDPRHGIETRSKNVYVNYIIKY